MNRKQWKKEFNRISIQIRWVKQQKSQAYRENRLEDARNFERDQDQLRHLSKMMQATVQSVRFLQKKAVDFL